LNKYVFHDIDDVLLPWDFPNLKWLSDHTGFDDWQKHKHPNMNYVSYEMLNMIHARYGEHIVWLTTWELHGFGANKNFCDSLGLPHYKEIPFIGDYYKALGSGLYVSGNDAGYWWKSTMLLKYLEGLEDQDYKAVWIDDEIANQINLNGSVHEELINNPKLLKITTKGAITKNQIQQVKDWLDS